MNIVDKFGSNLDTKKLLSLARVAETAELYNDCYEFMSLLTTMKFANNETLNVDERNILSVAIKNMIGSLRASLRTLNEEKKENYYTSYKTFIKHQIKEICEKYIDLITTNLLPLCANNNDEEEVYYNKAIGDYYRYLAECFDDIKYKKNGEKYYENAMDIAVNNLNETHPTRLGLALNLSVFYTEILKQPEKACKLAKQAFDSSIEKLDTLNDSSYKDSTLIMQLLRDNLTMWTGDGDGDGDVDDDTIGFAVGGARDVNNFRECIEKSIMPKPGSITFNGLLYEYYFDTKSNKKRVNEMDDIKDDGSMLFYPSYCYAKINKLDFMMNEDESKENECEECYMSVGLNSNIKTKDFQRKLLNLVIVLDKSGSMTDCFDDERQDYYAQFTDNNSSKTVKIKTKMEIANECIVGLLKHLRPKDRFGLIVFDNEAAMHKQLEFMENMDINQLKNDILSITASGGTNFECGYKEAVKLYLDNNNNNNNNNNIETDEEYDNRIIFLTDAQPTAGITNANSLMGLVDKYSNNKANYIYTTFIGIGLDFNAKLIQQISDTRGCNYYSVQSTNDFNKVMDVDFEYMVTPLVFNVCLKIKCEGNSLVIDKVYGSGNEKEKEIMKNGTITKINTLFPSQKSKSKGGTKGGIQLIKLKKNNNAKDKHLNVEIEVTFEDKYGKMYKNVQYVGFEGNDNNDMIEDNNYYDNLGIRKAILLCKYGETLITWIDEEYYNAGNNNGNLQINDKYKTIFNKLIVYFKNEMKQCKDNELQKELDLLNKLVNN